MTRLSKQEFWEWAYGNLLTNTTRGVVAEYIVAKALGIDDISVCQRARRSRGRLRLMLRAAQACALRRRASATPPTGHRLDGRRGDAPSRHGYVLPIGKVSRAARAHDAQVVAVTGKALAEVPNRHLAVRSIEIVDQFGGLDAAFDGGADFFELRCRGSGACLDVRPTVGTPFTSRRKRFFSCAVFLLRRRRGKSQLGAIPHPRAR